MNQAVNSDAAERAEALQGIRDSVGAVVPRDGKLDRVRALRFEAPGHDPEVLARMGEMGWIGLLLPEEIGGVGLGLTELCAVAEELGRGLVPEPLVQAVLGAGVLAASGADTELERVIAGTDYLPLAWQETVDSLDVQGTEGAMRLFVPGPQASAGFLVPVASGEALRLCLCPPEAARIEVRETQDGGTVGLVTPDLSRSEQICGDIRSALEQGLEIATLATAAYLVGVMQGAFDMTLDYMKNRKQFGREIGSFQVMQHRAVDLNTRIALSRAGVMSAAALFDTVKDAASASAQRQMAVSRAKASAAGNAMLVTRQAVQMHGAIGFTEEYDVGLYTRKAMVQAGMFGSAAFHRRRFLSLDRQVAA